MHLSVTVKLMRVCEVPGKGLGLESTGRLAAGTVLLEEDPLAVGWFPSQWPSRCLACCFGAAAPLGLACRQCPRAAFCSDQCQRDHAASSQCALFARKLRELEALLGSLSDEDAALALSMADVVSAGADRVQEFRRLARAIPDHAGADDALRRMYKTRDFSSSMSWERFRTDCQIEQNNAFGLFDHVDGQLVCFARAVYLTAARFNHSCRPNVTRIRHGKRMIFVTNRPVSPGEELSITYVQLGGSQETRQSVLRDHYGFHCRCELCSAQKAPLATVCSRCGGETIHLHNSHLCVHHDRLEIIEWIECAKNTN